MRLDSPNSDSRAQMLQVRDAVHHDLDRNRDLLLDFFRGAPRPLGDHLHVVVGNVRIGLNRQVME
jgi:hypothetical protein